MMGLIPAKGENIVIRVPPAAMTDVEASVE